MMNGLISPSGSKIFADTFSTDRLVAGRSITYAINSEKQKMNSLVSLFQIIPSNFDSSVLSLPLDNWTSALSYEPSSSATTSVLAEPFLAFLILTNSLGELEFHFLKLKFPSDMVLLAFTYKSILVQLCPH